MIGQRDLQLLLKCRAAKPLTSSSFYALLSLWRVIRILKQENHKKRKEKHPACSANIPWKINKEIQSEESGACLYSCNLITAFNHCNISDQYYTQNHIHQHIFLIMVHNVTIIRSLAHGSCVCVGGRETLSACRGEQRGGGGACRADKGVHNQ